MESEGKHRMDDKVKVTYIKHSGFLVETKTSYLLFDYWTGEIPAMDYRKKLYVFSSHTHRDHYTKQIFRLENRCELVRYILSWDIEKSRRSWRAAEHVCFMKPHKSLEIDDIKVGTLTSTDEGVAFLVQVDGVTIYHAGDLHWWHWPGDPEEENARRREAYQKEIGYIAGRKIDLSFVVLDPRQEEAGGWGMDYFLQNVPSRYVFPMHCWEDYDLIRQYKGKNDVKYLTGEIVGITAPGQKWELTF
ncbi:MAG: MBL fold metallo-hydrolase [Clostridiales bacterium]|nr:MBL fold metallo-hydrolase [Clostridiales bacterium]